MKTGIACDWCETSAAVREVWPAANSAYCFYCSVARKRRECDLMIARRVRVSPRVKKLGSNLSERFFAGIGRGFRNAAVFSAPASTAE
jgi:hypothetical protein